MGISLDATTDDKATAPTPDAGQAVWDDMEDEAPDDTEPEAEADPVKEPEATAPEPTQDSTATTSDSETPEPQPSSGPTPADKVTETREKIRRLREREKQAKKTLNEARRGIDNACLELGRAMAEHPDFFLPAATETTEPPAVKTAASWRNAPIAMLRLSQSIDAILKKRHGIVTVGQIADYIEANGSMQGLDGITEKRCDQITTNFDKFLESQK